MGKIAGLFPHLAQGPELLGGQIVGCRFAALQAPDMKQAFFKIQLAPGQGDQLRDAEPMREHHQNNSAVPLFVAAALPGGFQELVYFAGGEEFTGAALGVVGFSGGQGTRHKETVPKKMDFAAEAGESASGLR